MNTRDYWLQQIFQNLEDRNILWLAGVRRVGKTTLCKTIKNSQYFDCELPSVRNQLEEPEHFFKKLTAKYIVLDEIHRLINPSEILKIAADHYKNLKIIATGSSTLAAKNKFKDTLTGRKHEVWLTPMINKDLESFSQKSIEERAIKGGLPAFYLSDQLIDRDYQEWIDSYWAKDLQELFVVDKRASFMKFMELLFIQSGELFSAQSFAAICEVSRQTIQNYLQILEITLLVTVLRPYNKKASNEIITQPKVFGFDSGFVAFFNGWNELNEDNKGILFEHLVLNELQALFGKEQIYYWRDKQKHEIDFIVQPNRTDYLLAIECKSKWKKFTVSNINVFRNRYSNGKNYAIAFDVVEPFAKIINGIEVTFLNIIHIFDVLK